MSSFAGCIEQLARYFRVGLQGFALEHGLLGPQLLDFQPRHVDRGFALRRVETRQNVTPLDDLLLGSPCHLNILRSAQRDEILAVETPDRAEQHGGDTGHRDAGNTQEQKKCADGLAEPTGGSILCRGVAIPLAPDVQGACQTVDPETRNRPNQHDHKNFGQLHWQTRNGFVEERSLRNGRDCNKYFKNNFPNSQAPPSAGLLRSCRRKGLI